MNDPGLDGPAQQAADDVERSVFHAAHQEEAEAEEQDFLDPRFDFHSLIVTLRLIRM